MTEILYSYLSYISVFLFAQLFFTKSQENLTSLVKKIMQEQLGLTVEKGQPRLTCLYHQPAYLLCTNKMCTDQDSIICANSSCKCQKQIHNQCKLIKVFPVMQKLAQKQKINYPYFDRLRFIENSINNLIQIFSEERERIVNQLQYLGFRQPQIDLLNRKKSWNIKQNIISGAKINAVVSVQNQPHKTQLLWPSEQQIKSFEKNWVKEVCQFIKRMKIDIKSVFKAKVQSNVLTQRSQIAKIQDLLPQRVSQMNLLYRASQNQFQIKNFHQNCDGVANTVTMIRTQTDHLICAYTPNKWDTMGFYHPDYTKQSFIYSFNQQRVFRLKDIQKANGSGLNYGPIFGYDDILITNQSNIKPSTFNIGKFFSEGSMEQNNQNQWTAFCGSVEGNKITLKEWQIYQVVFQKQEK